MSHGEREQQYYFEIAYKNGFTPERAAKIFDFDIKKYREYYDEQNEILSSAVKELLSLFTEKNKKSRAKQNG